MKKILLIDGNSIFYRSFYANQYSNLNYNGVPTNGIYTFANMLINFLRENDYYDVKVAFDKGKNTFRHKMYDQYKAGRSTTPEQLIAQLPIVREFLNSIGIGYLEMDEFEADDIVGSYATIAKNKNFEVHILSSDKDLWQLVNDSTFVFSPISGVKEYERVNEEFIFSKWNIKPNQIPDLKGIMGDSSDNIKGVPGVGEVGAKKLLIEYGSIDNVYKNIDNISGILKTKLINGEKSAHFSRELAIIKTDINIDDDFSGLNLNDHGMKTFFEKYNMNSLVKKFCNGFESNVPELNYKVVKSFDEVTFSKNNYIYFEILNENYHAPQIIGIGLNNGSENFYIEEEKAEINIFNWNDNNISKVFQEKLLDDVTNFETYDLKKTFFCLKHLGYQLNENQFNFDSKTALYTLNPESGNKPEVQLRIIPGLSELESDEDIFGKGVKRTSNIDENIKKSYIVRKTNELSKSVDTLKDMLKKSNQYELFNEIDMPLNFVLINMEKNGVSIDQKELEDQKILILKYINEIESKIINLIDNEKYKSINLMSPKQLKELLYVELKLPNTKKGSTDKEALDEMINLHPIIPLLIEYRKMFKLYSTYLKGFEKYIFKGKVHSKFNQNLTSTGRLSSSDPNLQNISIRDEIQKKVRKIFITSSEKNVFLSFDYSQIELRILAQMSREENMVRMFNSEKDIHTFAAMKIFDIKDEKLVTSEMRRVAKVFNFGIIYGLSDFGLARDLKITVAEAKKFISSYFKTFSGLLSFKKDLVNKAKTLGYAETIGHRKRMISQLNDNNYMVRNFGERIAVNMPIQGTASNVIKIAMINIYKEFTENKIEARIIAQIHDELIIETDLSNQEIVKQIVESNMKSALTDLLKIAASDDEQIINLELSYSFGRNWYELK